MYEYNICINDLDDELRIQYMKSIYKNVKATTHNIMTFWEENIIGNYFEKTNFHKMRSQLKHISLVQ